MTTIAEMIMKTYWIKWRDLGQGFNYQGPWWCDCYYDGNISLTAAIKAKGEEHAKLIIKSYYDKDCIVDPKWLSCEEKSDEWSPFSSYYQENDNMIWPFPIYENPWMEEVDMSYTIAIKLGIITPETYEKWVFWTANPISDFLADTMEKMTEIGILESTGDEKKFPNAPGWRWKKDFKIKK